jgi:tetratricopeptide (TPR) repeat protein
VLVVRLCALRVAFARAKSRECEAGHAALRVGCVRLFPDGAAGWVALSEVSLAQNDPKQARVRVRPGHVFVAALLAACCVFHSSALAQPSSAARADSSYDALVLKGIAEYERGNWIEANAFFTRAHALQPNARTLRSLGMVAYELRTYVEAIGYFQAALQHQQRPLTAEMRSQIDNMLREAEGFIARIRLDVEPATAKLSVDGQAPTFDPDQRLMLDAGQHEIVVTADGFESLTRELVARPGDRSQFRWRLAPVESQQAVSEAAVATLNADQATDSSSFWDRFDGQQKLALGVGAAGVVTLGVAATFTALMLAKNSESNSGHCTPACDRRGFQLREDARRNGNLATYTSLGGAALLSAALIVYLTAPGVEDRPTTALRVTPLASLHTLGLDLGGAW